MRTTDDRWSNPSSIEGSTNLDVTVLTIGFSVRGSEVVTAAITRNTAIPTTKVADVPYESIMLLRQALSQPREVELGIIPPPTIDLFVGLRPHRADCRIIGSIPLPVGTLAEHLEGGIEMTFIIDVNDVLSVAAHVRTTGCYSKETITDIKGGLSSDEICRMVRDAERNAGEDEEVRMRERGLAILDLPPDTTEDSLRKQFPDCQRVSIKADPAKGLCTASLHFTERVIGGLHAMAFVTAKRRYGFERVKPSATSELLPSLERRLRSAVGTTILASNVCSDEHEAAIVGARLDEGFVFAPGTGSYAVRVAAELLQLPSLGQAADALFNEAKAVARVIDGSSGCTELVYSELLIGSAKNLQTSQLLALGLLDEVMTGDGASATTNESVSQSPANPLRVLLWKMIAQFSALFDGELTWTFPVRDVPEEGPVKLDDASSNARKAPGIMDIDGDDEDEPDRAEANVPEIADDAPRGPIVEDVD